ncbi:hypothetical protein ABG768_004172 [Culter alburnus]|uniref:Uncharacterized protein n=1 Tax=Culter alburnus TaxID=194366 RepID=A0AAW1ZUT5_CULAL
MGLVGKDLKCPGTGEGVSGKPTAATWLWFVLLDEVFGQRYSNNPPVLIASIPEDTPGPSSAVDDQDEERPAPDKRKRDCEDELTDTVISEEIKFQREREREREEWRAQESRERMDRLFSLLEIMVEKFI